MSNFKLLVVLAATCAVSSAELLTVKVHGESDEKPFSYDSSAVYVDESGLLVLGLPNDKTISKVTYKVDEKEHESKLLSYDQYARYAFISLPKEVLEGKKVSNLDSTPQPVFTVSNEENQFRFAGKVGRHNAQSIPFSFYRIHGATLDTSVFPILLGSDGNVAGIVHSDVPDTKSAYYVVPSEVFAKTLDDIKRFGTPMRAWIGVTLDANVGLPIVKSVRPGSAAAKAGIQKGDIVSSIGSKKVNDYDAAVKAFYLLSAEKMSKLSIIRGMKELKLDLIPEKFPTLSRNQKLPE